MINPYEEITKLLKSNNISYKEFLHEPVYTCEEADKVIGLTPKSGVKSMLLKSKGKFYLVVLPGDEKLDNKKLKQLFGKDVHFSRPNEVEEIMGCQIGACYPFGNIFGYKPYVDSKINNQEVVSIQPGRNDKTIELSTKDFIKLADPNFCELV